MPVCTGIRVYVRLPMRVRVNVCIRERLHVYMGERVCVCTYTYIYIYIYTRICVRAARALDSPLCQLTVHVQG